MNNFAPFSVKAANKQGYEIIANSTELMRVMEILRVIPAKQIAAILHVPDEHILISPLRYAETTITVLERMREKVESTSPAQAITLEEDALRVGLRAMIVRHKLNPQDFPEMQQW